MHENNENLSLDQETTFRVLYWAAYLGKESLVEEIIRLGYSPFVSSHDKKNALIAAIEGKQIQTVKLILTFVYIPKSSA